MKCFYFLRLSSPTGRKAGEIGPYLRKADAEADAKVLKQRAGKGLRTKIVRSNPQTLDLFSQDRPAKDPKPRVKPYTKPVGIWPAGTKISPREKAYLKDTYTVFLGRTVYSDGGGFDYWGDPSSGTVISVGVKGRGTTNFGPAHHWDRQVRSREDLQTTAEGREWRKWRTTYQQGSQKYGGLTGYEKTKAMLKHASKLIDQDSLAQADSIIRESGASRVDLSNILGSRRMQKMASFARASRRNSTWIQGVDAEIEDEGTEGAFTKQARRAGYKSTMEFARKVMAGWRSGKKQVWNKREKRYQRITKKTMYRANFAINAQKRRRRNG